MTETKEISIETVRDDFVGVMSGLTLGSSIDPQIRSLLIQAHQDYPVLVIRDQSLDPEAFMAFGTVFGAFEIDHHVAQYQDKNHQEIVYLTNRDKDGKPDPGSAERGAAWHADSTFKANPCAHTVLYAMEMPRQGAGTVFADMHRAYETLSDKLKSAIEGRDAKHKFGAGPADGGIIPMTDDQEEMHPPVVHPMVRIHPATGRKVLNINPLHVYGIVDMPHAEAEPLLNTLFAHALNPDFQYRHNYQVGELVIWDQRSTWHKAEAAYSMDEYRLLMRAKISAA